MELNFDQGLLKNVHDDVQNSEDSHVEHLSYELRVRTYSLLCRGTYLLGGYMLSDDKLLVARWLRRAMNLTHSITHRRLLSLYLRAGHVVVTNIAV